jgi:RNA polymerase sigma-B factor
MARPWTGDEERTLFRRYRDDRDPGLRDALVERFIPLARHLARRYRGGSESEDVLQVALLALVKAVDRFDPERGTAFTTFATPTILGEIKRYFRDYGWSIRVPRELQDLALRVERTTESLTGRLGRSPTAGELAEALDVCVERVLEALALATAHHAVTLESPSRDDEAPAISLGKEEPGFERVDDAVALDSLLGLLPPRERLVVVLRFRDDLLQREIAARLGVSQMQVSRTLARALATLRRFADGDRVAAPGLLVDRV